MGCEIMKIICNHGKLNYTKQRFTVASEWQKRTSEDDDRNILNREIHQSSSSSEGLARLHQGTIYHSFGEINWWESEERAKAAVKKVREDCREEEKGVGWWERQLQGKKSELCSRTAVLLCGLRCYAALMRPFLPVACDSVSSPPSPAAPRPPDTRL